MKKSKSLIVLFLAIILFISSCLISFNKSVYAAKYVSGNENLDYSKIYGIASNEFEFNPTQMLCLYAENGTGGNYVLKYRHNTNTGKLIPIIGYNEYGNVSVGSFNDGIIDGSDSSTFLALSASGKVSTKEDKIKHEEVWTEETNRLVWSLADGLGISRNDVVVTVTITMPEVSKYDVKGTTFTINTKDKYTEEVLAKKLEIEQKNEIINKAEKIEDLNWAHQIVKISATTKNNGEWKVVLGTDNNFYFLSAENEKNNEPENNNTKPTEGTPTKDDTEFETTLEYEATVEDVKGKKDGDTFLPPYFDNDNTKKDSDAIAIIKSKTKEEIKSTNGVDLRNDGKANSEGWYYPDVNDKTVIEKKYEFDDYDNTTDNGKVKETVKLTGAEGGEDTKTPSIKWTFRRVSKTETEKEDGSVEIVITYNLPVDKQSIPEGWAPIYDKDGKTIHKITKTIKKGEYYNKDITVKQNGTDSKVTTHVEKSWPKGKSEADNLGPQAGAFSVVFVALIAGVAIFAITRYRKINK